MSAERKVAKLEALLARIDARQRPLESIGSAALAASPPLPPAEIPAADPVPDAPPGAVVSASQPPRSKTPMEQALSVEVEETSVEIDYTDDEDDPIITIEPGPPDEPEDELDGMPTAPVGTPAVRRVAEPAVPARAVPPREVPPRAVPPRAVPPREVPVAAPPVAAPPVAAAPVAAAPEVVDTAVALASSPVAKVVSQPAPRTFGELLDRTLSLRPS